MGVLGSGICGWLVTMLYSHDQLLELSGDPSFDTPERGMIEMYGGLERLTITGQGEELFKNLHPVGAVVESEHCLSGPRCPVSITKVYPPPPSPG